MTWFVVADIDLSYGIYIEEQLYMDDMVGSLSQILMSCYMINFVMLLAERELTLSCGVTLD